jgi:hypothetical protein
MADSKEVTDGTPVLDPTAKVGFGLGMAAFVMAFVPWVTFATWLVAIPAIVLSVIGMVKSSARAQPILGLVFAILGWGVSLFAILITAAWLGPESDDDFSGGNESSQVAEDSAVDAGPPDKAANPAEPEVPAEYKSALNQAQDYSDALNLSKQGLYDQLVSEYGGQFTPEAAQYAVENVEADFKANALAQAKTYVAGLSLSPAAVYDQLVSEYGGQFTPEEAQYAVDNLDN